MLKLKSVITVQVNGKDYEFYCSPDSALQDAIEANTQMMSFLFLRKQEAQQQLEQKEECKTCEG